MHAVSCVFTLELTRVTNLNGIAAIATDRRSSVV